MLIGRVAGTLFKQGPSGHTHIIKFEGSDDNIENFGTRRKQADSG